MDEQSSSAPPGFAVTAAALEGSLVFLAAGLGWLFGQPPLETCHVAAGALLAGALAALAPLSLVLACVWRATWPLYGMRRVLYDLLIPLFRGFTVLEMAVVSLLAGLGEEMFFRGVVQASLARWLGGTGTMALADSKASLTANWIAAILAAALFGLAHWINLGYAIFATLMGLYLGWLWMATDNLLVPIVTHAAYDFLALLCLVRLAKR